MRTENDVLALFLSAVYDKLDEQRGIPRRNIFRYVGPADAPEGGGHDEHKN